MLTFERPGMRTGVIIVKEVVPALDDEGNPLKTPEGKDILKVITYAFKKKDEGKQFEFQDEASVLAKYPMCFAEAEGVKAHKIKYKIHKDAQKKKLEDDKNKKK